ncbi:glycoside hydrolase family 3 N-terminal domain-containing protein [Caldicellulosiruptor morganii]|uniref:Glycoside hydrolase family 3 C-terminal domain-containing protein n=1 Tax=Caldicellulosiruptor morganii TaxID=1387555 RepID=A0ABY7BMU4_9FIRM|nr:glycoside hydrolase family 3 N-terminal domain-containing protein [Caldicellulosiruptor morganii]WAM34167.1 glycoside hydrolase family 3 C-terminal domain-containing protein [Caldicellulosiruptor morganii]
MSIEKRVNKLLQKMTVEEKVYQLTSVLIKDVLEDNRFSPEKAKQTIPHGIGQITRVAGASNFAPEDAAKTANEIQKFLIENTRLGIPAMIHEESCSGFMAKGATVFPQSIGVACTFDNEIVEELAKVIRTQMKATGSHQALAPLIDVARDARWGRVEETFGEDPYLVANMAVCYVRGIQGDDIKDGIIATGKHFVGYAMSEGGMNWAPVHIPERELREVYLYPFEVAVKVAGLKSIMPAYHEIDGIPCHANRKLLTDIARNEWGFDGIFVSDYSGVKNLLDYHRSVKTYEEAAALSLWAGLDIELPRIECFTEEFIKALKEGRFDMALVDAAVKRVLEMKFRLGLFDNPYIKTEGIVELFDNKQQRELARKVAQESIVLLKNDNILPLSKNLRKVAVIGPNANSVRNLLGDYSYPAHISTTEMFFMKDEVDLGDEDEFVKKVINIKSVFEAVKEKVSNLTEVVYAKGCDVNSTDRSGFDEAKKAAKGADVVIVVVGDKAGLRLDCTSGESRDRASLRLPGVQEDLVKEIVSVNPNTVVVLVNGRPVALDWILENVKAVVEAWFPGEEGAEAICDVLFGDYNPGGKLAISFPRDVGQVPVYYGHKPSGGKSCWHGDYVEMSSKPLLPFGFGLSYTTFEYRNLSIEKEKIGMDESIKVSVEIENTGKYEGDEIVQLYTRKEEYLVTRPVKELKGYKRVHLKPGEKKKVVFELHPDLFAFYDYDMNRVVTPGIVEVMIGASSEDIKFTGSFEITGSRKDATKIKHYFSRVLCE